MGDTQSLFRRCSRCGYHKRLEEFTTAPSKPKGRSHECRECSKDRIHFIRISKLSYDELEGLLEKHERVCNRLRQVMLERAARACFLPVEMQLQEKEE